ncbi:flagellar biosynthesis/type III secretory pathway protein [Rheinheimera sp. A13L]|uniref:flagellar assembly protein FliH n=1 Tax=Rheinheimera sp. A13L TaxID=506534 RepID=UPI0002125554|nr:flagellar assembly protein FliH [Rheinheimera sp. A13L]EGM78205.1 flagellar biosynthesis/type III secretory pathway protein [Rheinheimera sp. A13L]
MTMDPFRTKQPFAPTDELLELLKRWPSPELSSDRKAPAGKTNALNKTLPTKKVASIALEEETELEIKPLTADDIEQIRQAAFDEGFAQGKEEGFSKGYEEGREQGSADGLTQGQAEGKKLGLEQASEEIEQKKQELAALLDQLQHPLLQIDQQVEQQLVQLCLAMAEAVIAVEVKTNPQVILKTLSDATSVLPMQTEHILIKLHPDDLALVEQHFSGEQLAERHWQLRSDPAIERGGCLLETSLSSMDRTIKHRLQSSLEHFLHSPD